MTARMSPRPAADAELAQVPGQTAGAELSTPFQDVQNPPQHSQDQKGCEVYLHFST